MYEWSHVFTLYPVHNRLLTGGELIEYYRIIYT